MHIEYKKNKTGTLCRRLTDKVDDHYVQHDVSKDKVSEASLGRDALELELILRVGLET
jgi:hypothetical protein